MAKRRKKSNSWRLPRIVAGLAIILLLVGAGGWYFTAHGKNSSNNQDNPTYSGPTKEEQSAGDSEKAELSKGNDPKPKPEETADGRLTANIVITDAAQYDDAIEVRSYVSNVFEDGNCTITFSKGGSKFQKTTNAFTDSSYTICAKATVPRSEFSSAGNWTVTIEYSSTRYYGIANQNLEIR